MQADKHPGRGLEPPWAQLRLPPFPRVAIQVMQLASRDNTTMLEMSALISAEPAFSAEVLLLANSPLYARRVRVGSILQAIALLGTQNLKGICLTVGVRAYLGGCLHHPVLRAIWRHSLACAFLAQELATAGVLRRDAAYTAGVIHDIGRLALAVLQPQPYAELLSTHIGTGHSMLQAERDLFGFDHCRAGAHLVEDWHLPTDLQTLVSGHHDRVPGETGWKLGDLIHVSCRMADTIGFAVFPGCEATPFADLLEELPPRERASFRADFERLSTSVGDRINALEHG